MCSSLQRGDSGVGACVFWGRVCFYYIVPSARRGLARGVHSMAPAPRWGRIVCGMYLVAEEVACLCTASRACFWFALVHVVRGKEWMNVFSTVVSTVVCAE